MLAWTACWLPRRSSAFNIVRASAQSTSRPREHQKARAELSRHQLTGRHHPGTGAIADFADQRNTRGNVPKLSEVPFDFGSSGIAELVGKAVMTLLDMARISESCFCAERGVEQLLEAVGDARDGGMDDQHARAAIQASPDTLAMLRQLASDETLVPPNLRTIHAEGVRVTRIYS